MKMNEQKMAVPGFDTPWLNGFHITFENGYSLSIQWKAGNYCENYGINTSRSLYRDFSNMRKPCKNAEIAVLDPYGEFIDFLDEFLPPNERIICDGQVCGYLSPEDVLYVMNKVAAYKKGE